MISCFGHMMQNNENENKTPTAKKETRDFQSEASSCIYVNLF